METKKEAGYKYFLDHQKRKNKKEEKK